MHLWFTAYFMATFRKMEAVVKQYNEDLSRWERQVEDKKKPPEKESILKKLKTIQEQGKQQSKPKQRKKSFDRDSR